MANSTQQTQQQRRLALRELRKTDPILWAICMGKASPARIADHLSEPIDLVQLKLDRYAKDKTLKLGKYRGHPIYKLNTLDLQRLHKAAGVTRFKNQRALSAGA